VLQSVAARIDGNRVQIDNGNGVACVEEISLAPPAAAEGAGSGQLKAPMDGAIVAVNVAAGDHVEKGQVLIVLEAMKIQHQITAGVAGTVQSINVSTGTQVKSRHLLAVIEPDSAA
jgi:geranyl-CoA carboxylase alpha subunit